MKKYLFFSLLLIGLSIFFLSNNVKSKEDMMEIKNCSLINLIATPEKYHNKEVRVVGYAVLEYERQVLYLSDNQAKNRISKNGLWLYFDDAAIEVINKNSLNESYVLVEGVFDMNMLGHGALNSGSIRKIKRLEQWSD